MWPSATLSFLLKLCLGRPRAKGVSALALVSARRYRTRQTEPPHVRTCVRVTAQGTRGRSSSAAQGARTTSSRSLCARGRLTLGRGAHGGTKVGRWVPLSTTPPDENRTFTE